MKIHKSNEGRASVIFNEWKQKNKSLLPLNFDSWVIHTLEHKVSDDVNLQIKDSMARQTILPFYKSISRVVQSPLNVE